jgi:hypothetical protein
MIAWAYTCAYNMKLYTYYTTGDCKIIGNRATVFNDFSSSKLVQKSVENRWAVCNCYVTDVTGKIGAKRVALLIPCKLFTRANLYKFLDSASSCIPNLRAGGRCCALETCSRQGNIHEEPEQHLESSNFILIRTISMYSSLFLRTTRTPRLDETCSSPSVTAK